MTELRITRASFLALVAGGLAAPRAFGDIRDDISVLQFALTLEYVESALYRDALKELPGLPSDVRRLVAELRDNEIEHVDALRATISEAGGRPPDRPSYDFGSNLKTEARFLKLANTIEDTTASAYNGAAPRLESREFIAVFASIAQSDARHAALIRLARGKPPAPLALDKASNVDAVRASIREFER
jgi:rubrerythrin